MNLDDVLKSPYAWPQDRKVPWLCQGLEELVDYHRQHCAPYARICGTLHLETTASTPLERIPFLPVQAFKHLWLHSVPEQQILKVLTSSGTTGQAVSRIALDHATSMLQTKALAGIGQAFLGAQRWPMVFVDHANVIKDRASFSARGAGLIGFSSFGRDHFYLLNESMKPDWEGLKAFQKKHGEGPVLFFGFTYMVWAHLVQEAKAAGLSFSFPSGILIHGGGWKKLEQEKVDNAAFKAALQKWFGLTKVHNYYGLVEQVGTIYMECERGVLHAPVSAEVLARDPATLAPLPTGAKGLLQVFSLLPRSYPGHSLLTEDLGSWLGEDDCPCGRKGKYFLVHGRMAQAELRGCSDTHAFNEIQGQAVPDPNSHG